MSDPIIKGPFSRIIAFALTMQCSYSNIPRITLAMDHVIIAITWATGLLQEVHQGLLGETKTKSERSVVPSPYPISFFFLRIFGKVLNNAQ